MTLSKLRTRSLYFKYMFSLLAIMLMLNHVNGQTKEAGSLAMFHGCEKHCGVYVEREYKSFGDVRWKLKTNGKIFSSPAIEGGAAYIGSEDKYMYAIDATSGEIKWKFKTGGAVHSSPAVYHDMVYFGSFDGNYYAVNVHTGKEVWRVKTKGEKKVGEVGYWGMKPDDQYMEDPWDIFLSSPTVDVNSAEPVVFFGSSDGSMFAVSAKDGYVKWRFRTEGIIHTSPALYKGILYIGSWDANLYAIDAKTGKEKWRFKTGTQPMMTGIQASPTIADDKVYVGARDAYMYCLDAFTGNVIWRYNAEGSWILSTAAVKDSTVYIGTSDSFLFLGLDADTGKERFRFKTNGYVFSSPALVGNTAFFGDFTGNMFAFDLSLPGNNADTISMVNRNKNSLGILNKDGNLDFKYAANGDDLSYYNTTVNVMNKFYSLGSIVSSAVVNDGVVYFGSADGNLYAINLKEEVISEETHAHQH